MTSAVEKFLSSKGCTGDELLSHPETADTQTAREWASEFIENNPQGLHGEDGGLWDWDDFDTLIDLAIARG